MMEVRILYLDIDDEITTAANRVREADASRIAMVLPYGSRVATSRINFRLLSRDATLNGKRLSIVAGDAATRALAASAGLPIFATVAEFESAMADESGSKPRSAEGPSAAIAGAGAAAAAGAAGAAAAAAPGTPSRSPRGSGGRKPRGEMASDAGEPSEDEPVPPPLEVAAAGAAAGAGVAALATDLATRTPPAREGRPPMAHRIPASIPAARVVADTPSDVAPAGGSRVRSAPLSQRLRAAITRTPVAIGLAVLALALVVGGVGAYLFLPTATAVISPRESAIGPIDLRIVADPNAAAADPDARVVPAISKDVPVEASQTFAVTGKRVEEASATGTVRFRNKDFTSTNTIPRGSIVSTEGGRRFRTQRAVTVPRAELVGLQVFPASATVKVEAVNAGPEGNLEPNTILVVPRGEDPVTLDVTNPEETTGGKREEFPRVVQADVDAATKAIDAQLASSFAAQLADPSLAADGTTVFPDTAALGEATYTVDPATLLGKEVESFDLGATATGTVLAVDETAVQHVAEANIGRQVQPGHALVDGSSEVDPAPGLVENGSITFPVTITARQVLEVDPAAVEAEIRGKSLAEARAILDRYGKTELSVWPDWVGTIPTLDARVDVQTTEPTP
jgi:hypothetical protein